MFLIFIYSFSSIQGTVSEETQSPQSEQVEVESKSPTRTQPMQSECSPICISSANVWPLTTTGPPPQKAFSTLQGRRVVNIPEKTVVVVPKPHVERTKPVQPDLPRFTNIGYFKSRVFQRAELSREVTEKSSDDPDLAECLSETSTIDLVTDESGEAVQVSEERSYFLRSASPHHKKS